MSKPDEERLDAMHAWVEKQEKLGWIVSTSQMQAHLAGQVCGEARAAEEITALREAVRLLCSNLTQDELFDGTMVWNLGSVIRTPAELAVMSPHVFPAIRRALEEGR